MRHVDPEASPDYSRHRCGVMAFIMQSAAPFAAAPRGLVLDPGLWGGEKKKKKKKKIWLVRLGPRRLARSRAHRGARRLRVWGAGGPRTVLAGGGATAGRRGYTLIVHAGGPASRPCRRAFEKIYGFFFFFQGPHLAASARYPPARGEPRRLRAGTTSTSWRATAFALEALYSGSSPAGVKSPIWPISSRSAAPAGPVGRHPAQHRGPRLHTPSWVKRRTFRNPTRKPARSGVSRAIAPHRGPLYDWFSVRISGP